jgi:adenine-specific DNA methylase
MLKEEGIDNIPKEVVDTILEEEKKEIQQTFKELCIHTDTKVIYPSYQNNSEQLNKMVSNEDVDELLELEKEGYKNTFKELIELVPTAN